MDEALQLYTLMHCEPTWLLENYHQKAAHLFRSDRNANPCRGAATYYHHDRTSICPKNVTLALFSWWVFIFSDQVRSSSTGTVCIIPDQQVAKSTTGTDRCNCLHLF